MSSYSNSAIEKLIAGCVKGDRKCQQKIYELYYSKMMGVCIRYSNNRDEAKDLLHDGFLKVFNNINKFDHKGSFEGWVRKIMINTTIDNFRKSKPIYLKDENELANIEDNETNLNILSRLRIEDILKAVQNLSPAYRAVFNLYVIEGYTHKEVAKELGVSVGTSKSNLAKAKYNLRKVFTKVAEK